MKSRKSIAESKKSKWNSERRIRRLWTRVRSNRMSIRRFPKVLVKLKSNRSRNECWIWPILWIWSMKTRRWKKFVVPSIRSRRTNSFRSGIQFDENQRFIIAQSELCLEERDRSNLHESGVCADRCLFVSIAEKQVDLSSWTRKLAEKSSFERWHSLGSFQQCHVEHKKAPFVLWIDRFVESN